MNGTSCDKCMTGYSPKDVDQCKDCDCDFCSSCMKNHDKKGEVLFWNVA